MQACSVCSETRAAAVVAVVLQNQLVVLLPLAVSQLAVLLQQQLAVSQPAVHLHLAAMPLQPAVLLLHVANQYVAHQHLAAAKRKRAADCFLSSEACSRRTEAAVAAADAVLLFVSQPAVHQQHLAVTQLHLHAASRPAVLLLLRAAVLHATK